MLEKFIDIHKQPPLVQNIIIGVVVSYVCLLCGFFMWCRWPGRNITPREKPHASDLIHGVGGVSFLVVILCCVIAIVWEPLHTLWKTKAAQGWDEVPAHIMECQLVAHRQSIGGALISSGVDVTYYYTMNGENHTVMEKRRGHSESCGLQTFQRLSDAKASGEAVPCRVNPDSPNKATLFWEICPEWLSKIKISLLGDFALGGFMLYLLYKAFNRTPTIIPLPFKHFC